MPVIRKLRMAGGSSAVVQLRRRFGRLKRLRKAVDRRRWVDELPTSDINRLCSCIRKIVNRPDAYLTPRTKTTLKKQRALLHSLAERGRSVERRRGDLRRLANVKSGQKGGFFLAGKLYD